MLTIETSARRKQIDDLIDHGDFDAIGELEGITIVEKRTRDVRYRCAEYVFRKVKGETWARRTIPVAFWNNTLLFLDEHGYRRVEELNSDDIVGYASDSIYTGVSDDPTSLYYASEEGKKRTPPYFQHFGVYLEGNQIKSKLNNYHIVTHNLDMVPNRFGTQVYFFRKV